MFTIIIITAFLLDLLIGDPCYPFHPVRLIGHSITFFETPFRKISANQMRNGIFFTAWIILLSTLTVCLLLTGASLIGRGFSFNPVVYIVSIFFIYSLISLKDLKDKAMEVHQSMADRNLMQARKQLSMIVSRETADLPEKPIIRAVVETVAENIVDGVIAPLFYCLIGGVPLLVFYKAVNTLDSMVGYKNEKYRQFGWASARLDDLMNYLPARLGGLFIPLAFMLTGKGMIRSWKIRLRDGHNSPSPNSGIPEAAVAGGLGIQLGGINYYHGRETVKPFIGDLERELELADIKRTIRIAYLSSFLFLLTGIGVRILVTILLLKYLPGRMKL